MNSSTNLNCDYFSSFRCRSCSLLDKDALDRLPRIPDELTAICDKVLPWVKCKQVFGSRAKAKLSVTGTSSKAVLGILDNDLEGVELLKCPLHKTSINQLLQLLPEVISEVNLEPYSIQSRTGELKGIIVQTNQAEDHLFLRFVLRSEAILPKIENAANLLSRRLNRKLSVSANIQPIAHQIPEGPTEHHLFGETLLWESYNDIQVAFPAQSFMQVTPEIAQQLYLHASKVVEETKGGKLLDLFCGAGGFALNSAKHCDEVIGLELSEQAIAAAKASTGRNGISNTNFIAADLSESAEHVRDSTTIICNPPRRGIGSEVTKLLLESAPEIIIYSSCNVKSLINDYQELSKSYTMSECTPFEMFPLTNHYELLSVLRRK